MLEDLAWDFVGLCDAWWVPIEEDWNSTIFLCDSVEWKAVAHSTIILRWKCKYVSPVRPDLFTLKNAVKPWLSWLLLFVGSLDCPSKLMLNSNINWKLPTPQSVEDLNTTSSAFPPPLSPPSNHWNSLEPIFIVYYQMCSCPNLLGLQNTMDSGLWLDHDE